MGNSLREVSGPTPGGRGAVTRFPLRAGIVMGKGVPRPHSSADRGHVLYVIAIRGQAQLTLGYPALSSNRHRCDEEDSFDHEECPPDLKDSSRIDTEEPLMRTNRLRFACARWM